MAVGFGITKPEQTGDGIFIGSAVVRLVDENKSNRDLVKIVAGCVSEIKHELA